MVLRSWIVAVIFFALGILTMYLVQESKIQGCIVSQAKNQGMIDTIVKLAPSCLEPFKVEEKKK